MRRLAVFQVHHTDVVPGLARRNAVERARASGAFDRVALAAADVPANAALRDWAESWGVELFLGDEHDVAARIAEVAERTGCELVARMLVWWFFGDLALVDRMLSALARSDADHLRLPRDFDLRFGADVLRPRFLAKVRRLLAGDAGLGERFRRSPWGLAEARPELFDGAEFEDVPAYGPRVFESVRAGMRELWPERWDGAETPLHPYRLAAERVRAGDRVLDAACGLGAGTALLARRGARALGVDACEDAVERCRARHPEADFLAGALAALDLPRQRFDVVTSVHTMEHLPDDRAFLARVHGWLRPGGLLVLEVPLLARRPFADVPQPLSPAHAREYDAGELVSLVAERFRVREAYGVSRGAYLPLDRARSAALVVAERAR